MSSKNRHSIRLKGYDYTSPGAYFVTVVTHRREYLFGEVRHGEMELNETGKIVDECWRSIPDHFPDVELGAYVVMPNHMHGIIVITGRGTIYRAPTDRAPTDRAPTDCARTVEQFGKPVVGSIPTIIRTFKSAVTRRVGRELNSTGIWQRNYYEHIIRNEHEWNSIHLYIETNPIHWVEDQENPPYGTIGRMTSPLQAIIFDFGNVLLTWDPRNLYQRFFPNDPQGMERFLSEVNFADWNLQQDKGRPFAEGIALLSKEFPHYAHLAQAYYDHWIDSVGGPVDGTIEIMKRLKQAGYPLYGLSNWSAETFPQARRRYDFFNLLDDIVLSGDVRLVKPDPEIYQVMLDKIGRPAWECLLIDDSLPNIHQAQKLGFVTIHFQAPQQLEASLRDLNILS